MKVSGIVDNISSRTVSNGGTVYTATIDGQEINLGFSHSLQEGEFVTLDVESTKWGLQVPRGPRKAGGTVGSGAARSANNAPSVPRATTFPVAVDSKDHIIIRQNALTNANTAVATAIAAGATFSSAEDVYEEIIKVAYNLTGFAMGTMDKALIEKERMMATEAVINSKSGTDG